MDIKKPITINEYKNTFLKSFSSILLEMKFPTNIPKKAAIHEIMEKYGHLMIQIQ